MIFNIKYLFETFDIVKETPFIEIDALSSKYLSNFLFNFKF